MTTNTPPVPLQRATTAPPSFAALLYISGRQLLVALRYLLLMTVVLGIVYPVVVLGVGQLVANHAANGSPVTDSTGAVVGSELIGQQFGGDQENVAQWFAGRPSAAGDGYDAMSSGGSNLAADSPDLLALVEERRDQIAAEDGVNPVDVPPDAPHRIRVRAGPTHQPRLRSAPGRQRRRGPRVVGRGGAGVGRWQHRGPDLRIHR